VTAAKAMMIVRPSTRSLALARARLLPSTAFDAARLTLAAASTRVVFARALQPRDAKSNIRTTSTLRHGCDGIDTHASARVDA